MITSFFRCTAAFLILTLCVATACKKDEQESITLKVISASTNVQAAVDEYRALLGANNGGTAGSQATGRREINWDGVPDSLAAPNNMPFDFFNTNTGTRARGAVFSTPGTAVQVSADNSNASGAATSFGNINPTYTKMFPPFSAERVFSPIGSNIVDLRFYVPGSTTKAVVNGFGAVYIDVDRVENTAFEYFDINDKSLGVYKTLALNEGHVFLGVLFKSAMVHRVRIEYGNSKLGPNESSTVDVAVMDDFIYGEPQASK